MNRKEFIEKWSPGDLGYPSEPFEHDLDELLILVGSEKLGRGGEPGCLHEIVRRTPDGHYHCANSNCHEGFMSRNDAQVWAAKEIAALESDLGAQGVELDDLRRKCREYELDIEHLQAVGGKAHEKGGDPGCWACRLFVEIAELKADSALIESMLKERGFGGEPAFGVRDLLKKFECGGSLNNPAEDLPCGVCLVCVRGDKEKLERQLAFAREQLQGLQNELTEQIKIKVMFSNDREKFREVLKYVFDCIEPIAHTGRVSQGGEQRGNSMHVEWAFAKVNEALK